MNESKTGPARSILQSAVRDLADLAATSRWVRSGRLRLHVLDYANDRPPLVVVPGITTPAIAMDFVASAVVDLVRPVVIDARGRGLSDSGTSYSLADYAADVMAVVDQLDLARPILLGHSLGARVAAAVAARSGGAENGAGSAIRGSILVDPPMSGPGRDRYPFGLDGLVAQLSEARVGTTVDSVARSWPNWPRREQELRARWLATCDETAVRDTHRGFETEDFFGIWRAVPSPASLIYGEASPVVTGESLAEAREANPAACYTGVPDAGHMVFWDQPAAALAAVREDLSALIA